MGKTLGDRRFTGESHPTAKCALLAKRSATSIHLLIILTFGNPAAVGAASHP